MNGLRVVLISRKYWPLVSDDASFAADLSQGLQQAGYQVTVLTAQWHATWPPFITDRGVRVLRMPQSRSNVWGSHRYVRALSGWLRKNTDRFDAVLVLGMREEAEAALAATAGARYPVVLVASAAGLDGDCYWQLESPAGERIKRACMKAAALIAGDAMLEAELIAAGFIRERIHRITPGLPELPAATTWNRDQVRAALLDANRAFYIPNRAPLVVHTGPLIEGRGLQTLLAAWPRVLVKYPMATLWIAGDGPLRGLLLQMCERLRLHQRVLLPGTFDQPADLMATADAFVAPAPPRGPCRNLMRAMAVGLPIVAAAATGTTLHPLIEHDRTGVLTSGNDAETLADAILRLLDDPLAAQRLGDAARQQAASCFSLSHCVQRYQDLLERLCSPDSLPQPQPVSL